MIVVRTETTALELTAADLSARIGSLGFAPAVADRALAELARAAPAEVAEEGLRPLMVNAARRALARGEPAPNADPRFVTVPPPPELVSDAPELVDEEGVTLAFSSYRTKLAADLQDLRARADDVLTWLADRDYDVATVPAGETSRTFRSGVMQRFNVLFDAAPALGFAAAAAPDGRLGLLPGELPVPVAEALTSHYDALTLDDVADFGFMNRIADVIGFPALDGPAGVFEDVAFSEQDSLQMDLSRDELRDPALVRLKDRVASVEPLAPNFIEGGKRSTIGDAKIARFTEPPRISGGEEPPPDSYRRPIVLSFSDLHMSQERLATESDGAEDGGDSEEGAYAAAIRNSLDLVAKHRKRNPLQPAYIVLNGDIFDFWAADLTAGPRGQVFGDFERRPGGRLRIDQAVATDRMARILKANKAFLTAVNEWVEDDELNFCVYVGGNHDDHIGRYGLGAIVARALHPTRAAFVSEAVMIDHMSTRFEHGHRADDFNRPKSGLAKAFLTSLGELMVSILVNPLERRGIALLTKVDDQAAGLRELGIADKRANLLPEAYRTLRRVYLAAQSDVRAKRAYDWLTAVDNLSNELDLVFVANTVVQQLKRFLPKERFVAAKVDQLPKAIATLLSVWLSSEYQSAIYREVADKILRAGGKGFAVRFKGYLLGEARRLRGGVQRKSLEFDDRKGYGGYKILCVGHTHRPQDTFPKLTGARPKAQFFNTGTGQDTYDVNRGGALRDGTPFKPVARSFGCVLSTTLLEDDRLVVEIEVGGFEYRSLQTNDPTGPSNLSGLLRVMEKRNIVRIVG